MVWVKWEKRKRKMFLDVGKQLSFFRNAMPPIKSNVSMNTNAVNNRIYIYSNGISYSRKMKHANNN